MKHIIFINSHPIQYFAPLYKYLNSNGLKTKAWYCSDFSIKGGYDREFGLNVKWDIPLLEGYEFKFFKNLSKRDKSSGGFFSLLNIGMLFQLFKEPKSIFVVHGWNYFSHFFVLLLGKFAGHTVCLRTETPLIHENKKSGLQQKFKNILLKYIVFPRVDHYLYIGTQNKMFFKSMGVKDEALIFCPYSIDNQRFASSYEHYKPQVSELKEKIGIDQTDKVILYSGKYINKKRPMDLLKAFESMNKKDCWLIMIGEGELRKEMEDYINANKIDNVVLTGFINQTVIAEYYALGDVFVMCSTVGETWGLSVNEAMNFDLPVVLSDLTGSSHDLIKEGVNGYSFETGNVSELAQRLDDVLYKKQLTWSKTSKEMIKDYSYHTILSNLKEGLN